MMDVEPRPADSDCAARSRQETTTLRSLCLCLLIAATCSGASYMLLDITARQRIGFGELSRLAVINDWYAEHDSDPQPTVLVLGDSLGRSAFNARIFNEDSAGKLPPAWNLASSARTYPEMLLDISHPALSEATVILYVSPVTSFSPSKLGLDRRKANIYGLLGLPSNLSELKASYGQTLDSNALRLLEQPRWLHVLASRWRLPELVKDELQMRLGAKRDRHRYLLTTYMTDLQYPAYGHSLSRSELAGALEDRLSTLADQHASGLHNPGCVDSLRDMVRGLREHSERLIIVMYPLDPAYRSWLTQAQPDYGMDWLSNQLGSNVEILDLTNYSAPDLFRDDLHISDNASEALTLRIMDYLTTHPGPER